VPPPLPSRPPLDPAALDVLPWRVEVLDESPSTNAYVARRARDGEAPGLVVVTEHQTAGRGRLDRVWVTPRGAALTLSLLVAPAVPPVRWPWLPLLTGLAVVDAVRATGLEASLKWPNDVLVGDAKVAGILVERVEREPAAMAVVGVGVNVTSTRDELPVPTATSLALAGGRVDRTTLLAGMLDAFSRRYDGWVAAAGDGLRPSYARVCSTIGRQVRVGLPMGHSLMGTAVDVDEAGRLLVDDGTTVHALGVGDVVHVRTSDEG
jgi:BirA family biotin operon repressor/biotin-[acetyl-CoA-carboxylase] ligase